MNLTIREYNQSDNRQLLLLFESFGNYIKDLDRNDFDLILTPVGSSRKYLQKMLADVNEKEGKVFVIENKNLEIIGFIAGIIWRVGEHEDEFDCKKHTMGRITELFIRDENRQQGLGTMLMQKMEEYFKFKNCLKVNIEVFGPNTKARKFYSNLGYKDRNIDMAKPI